MSGDQPSPEALDKADAAAHGSADPIETPSGPQAASAQGSESRATPPPKPATAARRQSSAASPGIQNGVEQGASQESGPEASPPAVEASDSLQPGVSASTSPAADAPPPQEGSESGSSTGARRPSQGPTARRLAPPPKPKNRESMRPLRQVGSGRTSSAPPGRAKSPSVSSGSISNADRSRPARSASEPSPAAIQAMRIIAIGTDSSPPPPSSRGPSFSPSGAPEETSGADDVHIPRLAPLTEESFAAASENQSEFKGKRSNDAEPQEIEDEDVTLASEHPPSSGFGAVEGPSGLRRPPPRRPRRSSSNSDQGEQDGEVSQPQVSEGALPRDGADATLPQSEQSYQALSPSQVGGRLPEPEAAKQESLGAAAPGDNQPGSAAVEASWAEGEASESRRGPPEPPRPRNRAPSQSDAAPAADSESNVPEEVEASRPAPEPPPRRRGRRRDEVAASRPEDRPKVRLRRPWWEELFSEDFARASTKLTDAQIQQEVSFIEDSLGVAPGGTLLDLGCGTGHHAVELARRGYAVVGYDLSLHQLSLAAEVAQERNQKLNLMQGDLREMAFIDVFDGIVCWNSTFGYFEEEKNVEVVRRIFQALKPGGTFLIDVLNRDFATVDQPSSAWFDGDSCVCMDEMSVDFITSRLRVKRSLILDDGRTRECQYSIRLYSLHELGKLLHDVGFRVAEASGHPATPGVFLGQYSPRIIIVAQRP